MKKGQLENTGKVITIINLFLCMLFRMKQNRIGFDIKQNKKKTMFKNNHN